MSTKCLCSGVPLGPSTSSNCKNQFGCQQSCPDFSIKRHDTKPAFRVEVDDCDGPIDFTDPNLVLETNMWAEGKLKASIDAYATSFAFADNIGFNQIRAGDVLVMVRTRNPEYMLVVGFDEENYLVEVERGYFNTPVGAWAKGNHIKIFRIMNGIGSIETDTQDIVQEDGTTLKDQIVSTNLVYEWQAADTCLPGCYFFEFKMLKMLDYVGSYSADEHSSGLGVEWTRRFPLQEKGFSIQIIDTQTAEL